MYFDRNRLYFNCFGLHGDYDCFCMHRYHY